MTSKTTKKTIAKAASAGKNVKAPERNAAGPAAPVAQAATAAPAAQAATAAPVAQAATAAPAAKPAAAVPQPPPAPVESPAVSAPHPKATMAAKTAAPISAAAEEPLPISPSWEEVARKAYELYESDGGSHGSDQEHWYRAEQALRSRKHG